MTAERRRALEIGGRVLFVSLCLGVLPDQFWADLHYWWMKMNDLGLHHLPYRDVFWEFPPLTVVPVALASVLRNSVTGFSLVFALLMALTEYATLQRLRARWPDHARTLSRYWYAAGIPIATIAYFRFDFAAAYFAVLALLAIEERRPAVAPIALGFGTKLWPAVLGVVLLIERRYRELAMAVAVVGAVIVAWYAFSPSGFEEFLEFRNGDGFQVEGVIGSIALLLGAHPTFAFGSWVVGTGGWDWVDPLMTVMWLALAASLTVVARRRRYDAWMVVGGLVLTLMLSSRLLSPQFLAWGLPFVTAAWDRDEHVAGVAFGAAAVITVVNLFAYESLLTGNPGFGTLGVIRNGLIGVAGVRLLVVGLGARAVPSPVVTAPRSQSPR